MRGRPKGQSNAQNHGAGRKGKPLPAAFNQRLLTFDSNAISPTPEITRLA